MPGDEVDLGPAGEEVRRALRQAAGDGEEGAGILAAEAPEKAQRVAVGARRDGAGVEDDDVGRLSGEGPAEPIRFQRPAQLRSLDLADLAAEDVHFERSERTSREASGAGKLR